MSKNMKSVGIIAEDDSDVEALKELIKRITGKEKIGFKNFVGRGCGKIKRKAGDWAKQLKGRGCNILILVHDLDYNEFSLLHKTILNSLTPFTIKETLICIPVQEMEAWFLSDPAGIKLALQLKKEPKKYHHPEKVNSPKEVLAKEIEKASNNTKIYINTKHNQLIAKFTDINIIKSRCPSFEKLHSFAATKI